METVSALTGRYISVHIDVHLVGILFAELSKKIAHTEKGELTVVGFTSRNNPSQL